MIVSTVAPPRWLTPTTEAERLAGDGDDVADFIQACCRQTKDTVGGRTGDPLALFDWQRDVLTGLFARRADGRLRHRVGLVGLPRKNGKSALASGVALFGLVCGPAGGEIYSCAGDREQARIVFGVAKRMVELDPDLAGMCKTYRDAIEVPATGSVYRVLSAEAYTKEGLSPTLVIFDEVHVQPSDELWNVMALAQGARVDPLMLGITTAGVRTDSTGNDSICYRLYQHGQKVASGEEPDPSFFMAWWEPHNAEADHRERATWEEANPGFGTIVDAEDFESACRRTPESEFRTKRCNQWVATSENWFPAGAFESRSTAREVPDGTRIVIGFDGSYSGDSTALVGATVEEVPHLFVIDAWERKDQDSPEWRVPIGEVEAAILTACKRWDVAEVACDPYRWQRSMESLTDAGLPIVEFATNAAKRMVPACAAFYDAVMDDRVTHDGDPRLERHVRNAVIKRDHLGPRIVKEHKMSPRKIDIAVCAVIAHERAVFYRDVPAPEAFAFYG